MSSKARKAERVRDFSTLSGGDRVVCFFYDPYQGKDVLKVGRVISLGITGDSVFVDFRHRSKRGLFWWNDDEYGLTSKKPDRVELLGHIATVGLYAGKLKNFRGFYE